MSAVCTKFPVLTEADEDGRRTFEFEQAVPMSSYLLAIAAGNLEKRDVGPRTAVRDVFNRCNSSNIVLCFIRVAAPQVWSEPEMVEQGAYEFADTEKFIAIAESFMTPYEWGRYGVCPSMPCLDQATDSS